MSETIIVLLILQISIVATLNVINPEQIHLSLGNCPDEMVVTWLTYSSTGGSFVWYGFVSQGPTFRAYGDSKMFVDMGKSRVVRYIHRVSLYGLKPDTYYVYQCGSAYGLSQPFVFKMSPNGTDWSPRMIIFGDMGWKGAATFPYIQREALGYNVDAIVHIGDIAYNMECCKGFVGDEFFRMIEPVAGRVPYMTTPGNHEQAYNFSHYKNRFSMPGRSEGLFYSFNLGPAHFIAISTEVYYFTEYGYEPLINQYNWLKNDLKEASGEENRFQRPWIIVLGHRPMYCSSDTGEDCSFETSILKCCLFNSCDYGLEDLFHHNRVDLIFSGHMHYYERSWPLYDNEVYNGSYDEPYRNARASVHIITGAAGMKGGTETAEFIQRNWFPFFSSDHSYTRLTVCNKTHLYLEQVSATRGSSRCGEVIDSMWLTKDFFYVTD